MCQEVDMYFDHIQGDDTWYKGKLTVDGAIYDIEIFIGEIEYNMCGIRMIDENGEYQDLVPWMLYSGKDGVMTTTIPKGAHVFSPWNYEGDTLTFVMEELPTDLVDESNNP